MKTAMQIVCVVQVFIYVVIGFVLPVIAPGMQGGIGPAGAGDDAARISLIKFIIVATINSVIGLAALYVILSRQYDNDTQKWAYGAIGLIIGYYTKVG